MPKKMNTTENIPFLWQVKEMSEALTRDKELTLKIEEQVESVRRYKDSPNLPALMDKAEEDLGRDHILVAILRGILLPKKRQPAEGQEEGDEELDYSTLPNHLGPNDTLVHSISSKFISENVHASLLSSEERTLADGVIETVQPPVVDEDESGANEAVVRAAAGAAAATGGGAAVAVAAGKQGGKVAARESLKYNPLGADVFLETSKVVGQNGTRLAGQVIVGVSAAFLLWDAIDLGWNVAELVRMKGSQAGRILRDKADELEAALKETTENFSVEMIRD